jgi:hypothetical protein
MDNFHFPKSLKRPKNHPLDREKTLNSICAQITVGGRLLHKN